ncbi:MAG: group II intron reverse transcriptase/maturase, partial [Bacilli bacterium]|nr:group II intron reverse transcriptase/maturase [Bacilli bacterium]
MRLIEEIASKDNLNQAFLQVIRNKGASGIDNMTCDEVKDYLKVHGQDLINQILSREYQPLPVRRVEIPKPNGGVRKLGIPTVVDRIVQQAIVQ